MVRVALNSAILTSESNNSGCPSSGPLVQNPLDGKIQEAGLKGLCEYKDINIKDDTGKTPLIKACIQNDPDEVKQLLENGADPTILSPSGFNALCLTAILGFNQLVKILCKNAKVCEGINDKDSNGETALLKACLKGDVSIVSDLLLAGADPLIAAPNGVNPLMLACALDNEEIVNILCSNSKVREHINDGDGTGETAFIKACVKSSTNVLRVLLAVGADPTIPTSNGTTPLMLAAVLGNVETLEFLCRNHKVRESLDVRDSAGETTLMKSCANDNVNVVSVLLEAGADPKIAAPNGVNTLMLACALDRVETVKVLCRNSKIKNFINDCDETGETALIKAAVKACLSGDLTIVKYLIINGADPFIKAPMGYDAGMLARIMGKPEVANCLMKSVDVIAKEIAQEEAKALQTESKSNSHVDKTRPPFSSSINYLTPENFGIRRSPDEALSLFTALNDSWWRQFIDGCCIPFGPQVFDEGRHGRHVEPGFLNSLKKGFIDAQRTMGDYEPSENMYRDYHEYLCDHFTGQNSTRTIVDRLKIQNFRDIPTECKLNEMVQKGKLLNRLGFDDADWPQYIQRLNSEVEKNHLGKIVLVRDFYKITTSLARESLICSDDPITVNKKERAAFENIDPTKIPLDSKIPEFLLWYTPFSPEEIHDRLILLFSDYNKEMSELNDELSQEQRKDERDKIIELKLRSIANLFQQLEWLHPFQDGQGRTDLLLLSKLLCQEGFYPTILTHPYVSTLTTLDEWVIYLKEGMMKWSAVRDVINEIKAGKSVVEAVKVVDKYSLSLEEAAIFYNIINDPQIFQKSIPKNI